MKILIIAPTAFFSHRGCHIRILEELKALKKEGHTTKTITYHTGDNIKNYDIERIINIPWYKKEESGPSWHKIYLDFILLIKSISTCQSFKPDVIHCHLHEGAIIGIILKKIFKVNFVFDSQGSLVKELKSLGHLRNSFLFNAFKKLEKTIYRNSPCIVVSNRINEKILLTDFEVKSDKLSIIPDGIDFNSINHNAKLTDNLKRRYKIKNKKTIVYLGTLNEAEGITDMLHVFSKLQKIRDDFNVIVLGYPNISHYRNIAKDLKIASKVVFLGKIKYEEIYSYLKVADFAISLKPPTSEGNGKLLNYSAIKLPIICYKHSSNEYILNNNELYLCHMNTIDQKVQMINKYLNYNPERLNNIAEKQYRNLRERFSWDKIGKKLTTTYAKTK